MAEVPSKPPFDAPAAALCIGRAFKMEAICPAEMWTQLAKVLSKVDDPHKLLDSLPAELQAKMRESYRERPISFWVLRRNPLRRKIKTWCRVVT